MLNLRLVSILFMCSMIIAAIGQDSIPRVINGVSVPRDFPDFEPVINDTTAPGYLWINAYGNEAYNIIFENDGTPVYYSRFGGESMGFTQHHNGMVSNFYSHLGEYFLYDNNMTLLDRVTAVGDRWTDDHEFFVAPNGNYLLIASEERQMDLSYIPGGQSDAWVVGNHVQELDQDMNLVYEWNCWDLFEIEGTQEDIGERHLDYMHMNSIAVDFDGHILTSSRHLSECTKLHRNTGEIIWRFGGKYNQFELPEGDVEFSYQHTFRPVEGKPNHYTIFDNGNLRDPEYSRAVEYRLDTVAMTAEKIWEYSDDQSRYASLEGSAQRLPNGNTLINFHCGRRMIVEVTAEGEVVFEAGYDDNCSYRAFRYDWQGMVDAPYLILDKYPDQIHLIFNKFGDNDVSHYNVYADTRSNPETLLDTTTHPYYIPSGLEPNTRYYFKISAVNSQGEESGFSEIEYASMPSLENNADLIRNGNMEDGLDFWDFWTEDMADAEVSVTDNSFALIEIYNTGESIYNIQFVQEGITLFEGIKYIFSFDTEVENSRIIEAKVAKADGPWTNYSRIGLTYLEQGLHSYEYEFIMQDPTDDNCRVVFNMGEYEGNVKLSNVKLIQVVDETTGRNTPRANAAERFSGTVAYPVPFDNQLHISFKLTDAQEVQVMLYDVNGRLVLQTNPGNPFTAEETISLNTGGLNPGLYFYKLQFMQEGAGIQTPLYKVIKMQD